MKLIIDVPQVALDNVLEIIDKYKAESEDKTK